MEMTMQRQKVFNFCCWFYFKSWRNAWKYKVKNKNIMKICCKKVSMQYIILHEIILEHSCMLYTTWWLLLGLSKAAFPTFAKKIKNSMKWLEKRKQRSMAGISTMFFSSGATGVLTSQGCFGRDKYIYMTCCTHQKLVCSTIVFL